jgi:hypothetical protein
MVFMPTASPDAKNLYEARETLTAVLRRVSAHCPGTSAEAAELRVEVLVGADGAISEPMCLSGALNSLTRLTPMEMTRFADFVAKMLAGDGFEIAEPVVVEPTDLG